MFYLRLVKYIYYILLYMKYNIIMLYMKILSLTFSHTQSPFGARSTLFLLPRFMQKKVKINMICLEVLIKWWGVFHFKLGPAALSPVGPSFHWTTKIHPHWYRKLRQHRDCHGGQVFVRLWACEWMIAYMNVRMLLAGCSFAYLGLFYIWSKQQSLPNIDHVLWSL